LLVKKERQTPSIMDQQISQMTPQQRQQILVQAQQEANQRIMQDMMTRMVKTCFVKCAGTSVRIYFNVCLL
jgi:tRNA A37 methylthiotransferase MiaB